jgi:osmotically-inducible protein OsmY
MPLLDSKMTERETPADIAHRLLRDSSYRPLRYLSCTFSKGVLTIAGHLPSFHLKQVAQNAVRGIEGVVRVENKVEVMG